MEAFGEASGKKYISQNGVKLRTICRSCNGLLGTKFDRSLIELSDKLSRNIKSKLILPENIRIKTKPRKIIHSVLGHLLSGKILFENTSFDQIARECVLNETPIPEDINILYWVYPYDAVSIIRDFAMPSVRGNFSSEPAFCQLLKFFPLAFLVIDKPEYRNLKNISLYRDIDFEDEIEIEFDLTNTKHYLWPESPDDGSEANFIMGGSGLTSSIVANPSVLKEIKIQK